MEMLYWTDAPVVSTDRSCSKITVTYGAVSYCHFLLIGGAHTSYRGEISPTRRKVADWYLKPNVASTGPFKGKVPIAGPKRETTRQS